MQETLEYRDRVLVLTDHGPVGHRDCWVLSKSATGWHIFYAESPELVHLHSDVTPMSSRDEALVEAKRLIDDEILDAAEWDKRLAFQPEVVRHQVKKRVEVGAFKLQGTARDFKVPMSLDILLRMHNDLPRDSLLRIELQAQLQRLAPTDGMGSLMGLVRQEDGSLGYDEKSAMAEVHRRKLERNVRHIQDELEKLAEGLRTVAGHNIEARLCQAAAMTGVTPLVPPMPLTSPAKALTAVEQPLLDALSAVAKRAHHFELTELMPSPPAADGLSLPESR